MRPYLIGITGGSGSGKTRFLNQLVERVDKNSVCLISQDNYYLPRDQQPVDENGVKNFDTPRSINDEDFAEDVARLKAGVEVQREEYTFNNDSVKPRQLVFKPAPIVIIEGLFVMHYPSVASQLDLKVFIEAKDHIKLKRRIMRDKVERGYDLDDVLYRFENHVMPTYDKYLEPIRHEADIVIPNNHDFSKAMEVLAGYLQFRLNSK